MFVEYTGIKDEDVKYACDACKPTELDAGVCAECMTDECNAIVTGENYKCDNYELTDKVFNKTADPTTCKRLNGTLAACKK